MINFVPSGVGIVQSFFPLALISFARQIHVNPAFRVFGQGGEKIDECSTVKPDELQLFFVLDDFFDKFFRSTRLLPDSQPLPFQDTCRSHILKCHAFIIRAHPFRQHSNIAFDFFTTLEKNIPIFIVEPEHIFKQRQHLRRDFFQIISQQVAIEVGSFPMSFLGDILSVFIAYIRSDVIPIGPQVVP